MNVGIPRPRPPEILSPDTTVVDDMTELTAFWLQYCNEDCDDLPVGSLSQPSNVVKCNKEDTIQLRIPAKPDTKYSFTHVKIFKSVTTWDSAQGMHDPGRDGVVGDDPFGGFETAVDSSCFLVETVPCSEQDMVIGLSCDLPCGPTPRCAKGAPPPDGMCVAGETSRGSLVGYVEGCVLFSERHAYHSYAPGGMVNLGCDIQAACTVGDTTFALTEAGDLYIILDDISGSKSGECRTVRHVRKTGRVAGGKLMANKQIMCDHTGFTWISDRGIMRATSEGAVINITAPWFGYDEWLNTLPSKMTMEKYRGSLFFSSPAYSGVLDINADGDVVGDVVPNHSTLSICPDCWISDCDGRLYFISCDSLWEFNAGAGCMCMKYRSTTLSVYGVYRKARIDFVDGSRCEDKGAGTVCIIADGKTVDAKPVNGRNGYTHRRIRAHEIAFEYTGEKAIRAACFAASYTGLSLL
jgi:hypothetical protein